MSARLRVAFLAAALSGAIAGIGAQSASAFPVVGLNIAGVPTPPQLAQAEKLGAKTVRMFVLWSDVQPARGALNAGLVSAYGGIVRTLSQDNVSVDFVVVRAPSWETGSADVQHPPNNPADYANFLAQFASTPGIQGQGVAYELWNEEDSPAWWTGAPDPAAYAALVKAAAPALRHADPTAKVILGPTTGNNYDFLGDLYGQGISGLTDAVAVHTDTICLDFGPDGTYMTNGRLGQFVFLSYREVHKTMVAHGEGDHPIWMTEFGWNSSQTAAGGSTCQEGAGAGKKASGVTADQQAQFITQAFHCMDADPYLQVANWFTLYDDLSQPSDSLRHYGLINGAGAPKPDYNAFSLLATQGDQLTGKCGDFDGPEITVQTPKLGQTYASTLPIMASASDPQGVTRITFKADDNTDAIDNFANPADGQSVGLTWGGAADLSIGSHTINVTAVDKNGNVSTLGVQVKKVSINSILAVGPVKIGVKKFSCNGAVCTIGGQGLTPAGDPLPGGKNGGKMQAVWQLLRSVRVKGGHGRHVKRFRTKYVQGMHANKPFKLTKRLKPGQWRVQVKFTPPKPLKPAASPFKYFTITMAKKHHR